MMSDDDVTHVDDDAVVDSSTSDDSSAGGENPASDEVSGHEDPLAAAETRIAELEDRMRRQEAEFVNETRRIRRQSKEQGKYAAERVVLDLLPVLDALHSAKEGLVDSEEALRVREGLDLVDRQLESVLQRHAIQEIEALDTPFDPNRHEAMLMVDDPSRPAQTVCQVMRPGYTLHGRVVRPAQVMVSQGGPPAAVSSSDEIPPSDSPGDETGTGTDEERAHADV